MNILESRRRMLGAGVYKKTVTGNPAIAQGSLARMYPGIEMQGWTKQASTTGAQLFDKNTVDTGKYVNDTNGNVYDGSSDKETSASDYILVSGLDYIRATVTNYRQWMAFYDFEKTYISGANGYASPIAVPDGAVYARFTVSNDYIDSFMVNAGQTLLPYEPYTGGQPSPSPDYPQEITSAGKYNEGTGKYEYEITIANAQTDPDKNQTVTLTSDRPLTKWDRLEKRNGVWGWVYKSAEIVLNGSERWKTIENGFYIANGIEDTVEYDKNMLIDKLIYASSGEYPRFIVIPSGEAYTPSIFNVADSVNGMKEWLASNPLTLWYETAEETFVPLSESEQELMNALYTFRPTTVLSNDCGCNMTLTYKTKKSLEVTT